jgi:hypothetical protein
VHIPYDIEGELKRQSERREARFKVERSEQKCKEVALRKNRNDSISWSQLIVSLLPLGFLILVVRWHDVRGSHFTDIRSLATTQGTIVHAETDKHSGRYGTSYHYDIKYEFYVGAERFRSDEVTFAGAGQKDQKSAQSYVERYRVGRRVTVYYDPSDPSFSVLEPSVRENFTLVFVSMIIGMAMFLVLVARHYFKRFSQRRQWSSNSTTAH